MRARALSVVGAVVIAALALAASRSTPPPPSGHALLLSDIHFDPLAAGPDLVEKLKASRIEAWDAILEPTLQQPFPTLATPTDWHDSNYALFASALANAEGHEPYDFVVVSGDVLRHDFDDQDPTFIAKTAGYVAQKVQRDFGVPTIFAIGNNDGTIHNQAKPNDPVFAAIAGQLTVLRDDPEAKKRFAYGGYCRLRHPTVPNEDILVLNSVFWSAKYKETQPGEDEMRWLGERLVEEAAKGVKTTLVMHIPPGVDVFDTLNAKPPKSPPTPFWKADFLKTFAGLMRTHGAIVRALIAGHTHMDDFRVMDLGGSRSLPMRITPSISPSNGNDPAFATFDYDPATGEMKDLTTYFTNLIPPPATPYVPLLPWGREYRFSSAYGGRSPFRGDDLKSLSKAIRAKEPVMDSWKGYNSVLAPNAIDDASLPYYACGQTAFTADEYAGCLKQGGP